MDFNVLEGKVITEIVGLEAGSEAAVFTTSDGNKYKMFHEQDCCEDVRIEEIHGEIEDVIGSVVTMANMTTNRTDCVPNDLDGSCLWTFYNLGTRKGSITIRWYGESNGFYSEEVNFKRI